MELLSSRASHGSLIPFTAVDLRKCSQRGPSVRKKLRLGVPRKDVVELGRRGHRSGQQLVPPVGRTSPSKYINKCARLIIRRDVTSRYSDSFTVANATALTHCDGGCESATVTDSVTVAASPIGEKT